MITRIEIDGFKSFHNFAVDLQPFTVLIGGNGTGKSNLLDAIRFLAALADGKTVREAFVEVGRGDPREMFALQADGTRVERMRFVVEIELERKQTDDLGHSTEIQVPHIRYELEVGETQVNATNFGYTIYLEKLSDLGNSDQLISTIKTENGKRFYWTILGALGGNQETVKLEADVGQSSRTLVSFSERIVDNEIFAARSEMRSWRVIYLDPYILRLSSFSYVDSVPQLEESGDNLVAVLQRLSQQDERALHNISLELANAVEGLREVKVQPLPPDKYEIKVITRDGVELSTRMLSDGTLRFIAYLALKHDREHRGVMCIEEPENGVHPKQLERIVRVLHAIATDFNSDDADKPLRQVIITTHSTALMAMVPLESLIYMYMGRQNPPRTYASPVVRQAEIKDRDDASKAVFTIDTVRQLLDTSAENEQIENLTQYRESLRPQIINAKQEQVP